MNQTFTISPFTSPHSPVLVGDPILPIGDKFVVLNGHGDFRQSQEMAMVFVMIAGEARIRDSMEQRKITAENA